ncbi:hypothetical protein [Sphingomonas sp. PAMC 26621]|uniref:hypothetical protein n=1 Tax=Sphingomonas sp. PAMC 26621 TaxID=1112213 RepID=UPI0011113B3E|nr:hypothetical protein [Sphingomonas sp. PAMC 26621]
MFEASGPGGPIKYLITPAAIAELSNDGEISFNTQQCMDIFKKFERYIHHIAQRQRQAFKTNLPPIVIRADDVRGE